MDAIKSLRKFVRELPLAPKKDSSVNRISGERINARVIQNSQQLATVCGLIQEAAVFASKHLNLSYSIYPARNKPHGFYVDGDIKYNVRSNDDEDMIRNSLNRLMERAAPVLVCKYVTNLIKNYLNAASSGERDKRLNALHRKKFGALYSPRPMLSPIVADGEVVSFKSGFHMHIGEVVATNADHITAYESTINELTSGENEPKELLELRLFCDIAPSEMAIVFDKGPIKSSNICLPFCRKVNGTITYIPTKIFKFIIYAGRVGITVSKENGEDIYYSQQLQPFFPIFAVKEPIDLSVITNSELEFADEIVDDNYSYEELLDEATDSSYYVTAEMIELLAYLPYSIYTADHENRIKIRNTVVHETKEIHNPSIRDRLIYHILKWYFNKEQPPDGAKWCTPEGIRQGIEEASSVDQRCGIGWLMKRVREHAPEEAERIAHKYGRAALRSFLHRCYRACNRIQTKGRFRVITHQDTGILLYKVLGSLYMSVAGNKESDRKWFKYDSSTRYSNSCKKWKCIPSILVQVIGDIRKLVKPALEALLYSSPDGGQIEYGGIGDEGFAKYISQVIHLIGDTAHVRSSLDSFKSYYDSDNMVRVTEFMEKLDALPDRVGVLNGILRFHPPKDGSPFRIEHLFHNDEINKDQFVSRSLNAIYDPNLNDDSPSVRIVWKLLREIVPNKEELRYILLVQAGTLIAGHNGGERLFLVFGTGGDAKTTLLNAFLALAGGSERNFRGYGATGDPRIFQSGKKDANSPDSAIFHMLSGPRIAVFSEPSSKNPYLDDGTIKYWLSGSTIRSRTLYDSGGNYKYMITGWMLLNEILELIGTNKGIERRMTCLVMEKKFVSPNEYQKYQGCSNVQIADPSKIQAFDRKPDLRNALLYILLQHLGDFYTKYNGDIHSIELPPRYKAMTKSYFSRHSSRLDRCVESCLAPDPNSSIPLVTFASIYYQWDAMNNSGSIRKRKGENEDMNYSLLQMISASPLGSRIKYEVGEGVFKMVGINELIFHDIQKLYIVGYRPKEDTTTNEMEMLFSNR